jgi:transporter family protein
MPRWLIYSLLAMAAWGVWGLVSKLAADRVAPLLNQVLCTAGLLVPALVIFRAKAFIVADRTELRRGVASGFLSGVIGAQGNHARFAALSHGGKASIVFPLTAVYPLVTVVGARLLLRENLHGVQLLGIATALLSIVVLNAEDASFLSASGWQGATRSHWMAYALAALGLYGLTAVLQKLSTSSIPAEVAFVCFAGGFIPVAVLIAGTQSFSWRLAAGEWFWAISGGALNGLGVLASLAAYRHGGKASIVTPLAALYPVITVALAVPLLHEQMGGREMAGIALAVAAGAVLSHEKTTAS